MTKETMSLQRDYAWELAFSSLMVMEIVPFSSLILPYRGGSIHGGTPKSSMLRGFSLVFHPFWGTPHLGNPRIQSLITLRVAHQTVAPQNMDFDLYHSGTLWDGVAS